MMIINGVDLVEIDRIKKSMQNPRFLEHVFSEEERAYFSQHNNSPQTVAAAFAAKEAFSKAIGKGVTTFSLNEVTVAHDMLGRPFFKFSGRAAKIAEKMKLQLSLSLSHSGNVAVAMVSGEGEFMYQTVIFDLDGTLIDTSAGVIASGQYATRELGLEVPDDEKARLFLGPPLAESFPQAFGVKPEEVDHAIELFREEYKRQQYNAKVYDGIVEILDFLKARGTRITVATLKHENFAAGVLEHFGIAKYMDMICGATTDADSQKEVLINRILSNFGTKPEDAVLIGDTRFDAMGAQKAGIDFLAVSYGFMREGEFDDYSPIALCASAKEIAYYL